MESGYVARIDNFYENELLSENRKENKAVGTWLMIGVVMIIIQILLGGITRLTGSGLSITEWKIVTGSLPPLNEQQWLKEFSSYQQTPQYQLINNGFTLHDFQFIFFWEWIHRLWARMMGLVFAVGFVYFLVRGKFRRDMVIPLIILFLLGGLQGLVGWIMVMSGFVGDAVYVQPVKLAMHFTLALGLFFYTFWFALKLRVDPAKPKYNRTLNRLNVAILLVLIFQLVYGALMAGHKAANVAPTWPDINGQAIPQGMFAEGSGFISLVNNKIVVQFIHRGIAYLLVLLVLVWTFRAIKIHGASLLQKTKWLPLSVILLQVLLGIGSVLLSPYIVPNKWGSFEWLAQVHQLTGMLFLLVMTWMLFINRKNRAAVSP